MDKLVIWLFDYSVIFKLLDSVMQFQKPTLEVILENLEYLFSDIDKIYWGKKIIESILSWDVYVWGVITFDNFFSNAIKFWTQSLYSHVTFCYPDKDGTCYVWWAENSKGLTIQKYYNDEDSVFVIKKLDLDRIFKNVNFDKFSIILDSVYGENSFSRALQRYDIFKQKVAKLDRINLYTLLEVEAEIEKEINEVYIKKKIQNDLRKLQEVLWFNFDVKEKLNKDDANDDVFFRKLFFSWWMVKFLLANYGKKYDYVSIFTMYLVKPFLKNYNYVDKWTRRFFCSEFVSATFLYAGFYPFDLYGKYPDLVVPGDLMDPDLWIYDEKFLKVIRYFSKKDLKPLILDGIKKQKEVYDLIKWLRKEEFLKTSFHILVLYFLLGLVFALPWILVFLLWWLVFK